MMTSLVLCALLAQAGGTQPPEFQISGSIVNQEGVRLRPGKALAWREGESDPSATVLITQPDGHFTIPNLAPGEYRLLVEATPFRTMSGRPVRHFASLRLGISDDITDLVVVASPGVTISGHVIFAEGTATPLAGVRVVATAEPGRGVSGTAAVGAEHGLRLYDLFGTVRIGVVGLPPGYEVREIRLGDADITDRAVELTIGDTRELTILVAPAGAGSG